MQSSAMEQPTHYQVLKVAENAPQAVIASAHHALSQAIHRQWRAGADEDAAVAAVAMLESAYDVLSDPERRAAYDEMLREQRAQTQGGEAKSRVKAGPPPLPIHATAPLVEAAPAE